VNLFCLGYTYIPWFCLFCPVIPPPEIADKKYYLIYLVDRVHGKMLGTSTVSSLSLGVHCQEVFSMENALWRVIFGSS
jgi:hypothetical protein